MGETSRELVTSLSIDFVAASKAVLDFETAVPMATQDVWTVVRIPRWKNNRSIRDPASIRHAYTKAGKDFSGCNISVQMCWKEEERRKAADSETKVCAQRLPTSIRGHLVKRSLPLSHR